MKKVITYGTYDLFHQGHYNLLKRAKALGDYLIVGVTSDAFDKNRGKLNVRDSLVTRIENVKNTGFADEIIVEEYIGQKIDDIKRYHIDVFTVGSDWRGHFDYLNEFCHVHYLERTRGVSSTDIRKKDSLRIGIIGAENIIHRFVDESKYVSGIDIVGIWSELSRQEIANNLADTYEFMSFLSLDDMFKRVDAVYVCAPPVDHTTYIKKALSAGKHVICEFPFCFSENEAKELFDYAQNKQLILFHALKTAYCPAFQHLVSLAKSGLIGRLIAVDASFTQVLGHKLEDEIRTSSGGSIYALGEYPALAAVKLLGNNFNGIDYISHQIESSPYDGYTKMIIRYPEAIATGTVAMNAKSEGSLVITGTKGYLYVPAPWWKTEYFEARFEDINKNMKYFFKFQGEGLRYEISEFVHCILTGEPSVMLTKDDTLAIVKSLEKFGDANNVCWF